MTAGVSAPDDAVPEVPAGRGGPIRRILGWMVAFCALGCLLLLSGHRFVPNIRGLGSLLETFLPWLGLAVPVLAVAALLLRSRIARVAVAAVAAAWVVMFGPLLLPIELDPRPVTADSLALWVITHNVWEHNPRPEATAASLAALRADVVAVQEVRPEWLDSFARPLNGSYPHSVVMETLAVWSRYPIANLQRVETGVDSLHAVRMTLDTPRGRLALYNVHLISPDITRRGFGGPRDAVMRGLTDAVARDGAERMVLVGDLNAAPADRRARRLLHLLDEAQVSAGRGFGFTWPARFPVARIDHMLTRGVTVTDTQVLGRTGSDHRPVLAELRF